MAPFVCFKFNLSKYSSPIHFFYENIFSGVVYALQMKMMQSNHAVRVAVWLSEAILYVVACGDFVWNVILNKKKVIRKKYVEFWVHITRHRYTIKSAHLLKFDM